MSWTRKRFIALAAGCAVASAATALLVAGCGGGSTTTSPDPSPSPSGTPPLLTAAAPDSGIAAGGTVVTLTGTGFAHHTALRVTFDSADATDVSVVSDTTLTCTTPALDVAPSGSGQDIVTVHVVAEDGSTTNPAGNVLFTYNSPIP